jgi:6-pyruvoyl-tetrahydropterin synthase
MEFEEAMAARVEVQQRADQRKSRQTKMIAVARRYTFTAHHHVEGLAEPWCRDHWHDYTVEVVAELQAPPGRSVVVTDTDELDRIWADHLRSMFEGRNLNDSTPTSTTVEALAVWILSFFPDVVREVTVWEDTTRWGRARR